ncbi:hypothetical protein BJ912DRAFT_377585 [Pholiota molesta]|nr:hypothetical protein BJ912DRAFT_377585 [Pholiota molesta]
MSYLLSSRRFRVWWWCVGTTRKPGALFPILGGLFYDSTPHPLYSSRNIETRNCLGISLAHRNAHNTAYTDLRTRMIPPGTRPYIWAHGRARACDLSSDVRAPGCTDAIPFPVRNLVSFDACNPSSLCLSFSVFVFVSCITSSRPRKAGWTNNGIGGRYGNANSLNTI